MSRKQGLPIFTMEELDRICFLEYDFIGGKALISHAVFNKQSVFGDCASVKDRHSDATTGMNKVADIFGFLFF